MTVRLTCQVVPGQETYSIRMQPWTGLDRHPADGQHPSVGFRSRGHNSARVRFLWRLWTRLSDTRSHLLTPRVAVANSIGGPSPLLTYDRAGLTLGEVMSVSQAPAKPSRARPARTNIGESPVSVVGVVVLGAFMAVVSLLALYGLWRFWPAAAPATGSAPATAKFSYFSWQLSLPRDQQFFIIVALAGVIGAMLHGLRSLSRYIGERYLFRSWIPYYILLPLVGGILATIVYLVLRAGLLPGATSASQPDPYGISAIAALVGLFSAQAAEKLKAVFETLFTKVEPGSQSVTDIAMPSITRFDPEHGPPGTSVVISGSNLTSVTGVGFTGADAPQFKIDSDDRLTVSVPNGATTGPITLHVGEEQVTSKKNFTVP